MPISEGKRDDGVPALLNAGVTGSKSEVITGGVII